MSLKMSKQARIELLSVWRGKYASVISRYMKAKIIDYVMQSAGYKNRKTVIRLLSSKKAPPSKKKKGRRRIIGRKELQVIKKLWFLMGQPCGKRMEAQLPEWLAFYAADEHIEYESLQWVLRISAATLDRALRSTKIKQGARKAQQESLSNLKKSIELVDSQRVITEPGHLYADTVSHGGSDASGDYAWTLTLTDDYTLWTGNRAVWNKGQYGVCQAFGHLFRETPFAKRSINTDNGAEFINYHLQGWLKKQHKRTKVTRSRPYHKNDNARAEERNRHKVRELVGKDRFDEQGCVRLLNEVYKYHDLLTNHFYASTRLISKHRDKSSGKYSRKYGKPQTPYQRLLATLNPESRRYKRLVAQHAQLNPIELSHKVEKALRKLYEYIKRQRQRREESFDESNSEQRLANPGENAMLLSNRLF